MNINVFFFIEKDKSGQVTYTYNSVTVKAAVFAYMRTQPQDNFVQFQIRCK